MSTWVTWIFLGVFAIQTPECFLVAYVNDYDAPMNFYCNDHTGLKSLASHHDNHREDRIWSMTCEPTPTTVSNCVWHGYANDYDKPVLFECPGDSFINGIESIHNNHHEDRIWSFECCQMQGYVRSECRFTGYVNTYDNYLSFSAPEGHFIHGTSSIHDNHYEDRIFAFETCKFSEEKNHGCNEF